MLNVSSKSKSKSCCRDVHGGLGYSDDLELIAPSRDAMQAMLQEALDAGAIGLSTGLAYASAAPATTEEVIGLARLLQPAGALCEYHCMLGHSLRSYGVSG